MFASLPGPIYILEIPPSSKTVTGVSPIIANTTGAAISAVVQVLNVSGTNPTLDMVLQESYDNGITWVDAWHFERLTSATTAYMPPMTMGGIRRWSWTITGSTPVFFIRVSVTELSDTPPVVAQFFDRTANLLNGTVSTPGVAFPISGCKVLTAAITCGAITTTAGVYRIEFSNDNSNWWPASADLTAVASTTTAIASTATMVGRFARLYCKTGATGQTGTVVTLAGSN